MRKKYLSIFLKVGRLVPMKNFYLIGLLLCLVMIGGVRGQELQQQIKLGSGNTNSVYRASNIPVATNQICEIWSYFGDPPTLFNEAEDSPTIYNIMGDLGSYWLNNIISIPNLASAPKPYLIVGPATVCFERPFWFQDGSTICNSFHIVYRIVPKAGYSPNVSPANLASNANFVSGLTQTILSTSNSYGLATRTELIQALAESRADGVNSVLNNPNQWTLYTTNQIKNMAIGDLVLTRTNNGQFVLNYDIEQSEDLANWTPYAGFAMPLTNLPTDKAFVRIKAKQ